MPTSEDTHYIATARKIVQALRQSVAEDASVSLLHTFLVAAENEGKTVNELKDLVGSSQGTISRHLLDLSESLRNGNDGYKLLTRHRNPTDLRSVVFTVAPKGRRTLNTLKDILEE